MTAPIRTEPQIQSQNSQSITKELVVLLAETTHNVQAPVEFETVQKERVQKERVQNFRNYWSNVTKPSSCTSLSPVMDVDSKWKELEDAISHLSRPFAPPEQETNHSLEKLQELTRALLITENGETYEVIHAIAGKCSEQLSSEHNPEVSQRWLKLLNASFDLVKNMTKSYKKRTKTGQHSPLAKLHDRLEDLYASLAHDEKAVSTIRGGIGSCESEGDAGEKIYDEEISTEIDSESMEASDCSDYESSQETSLFSSKPSLPLLDTPISKVELGGTKPDHAIASKRWQEMIADMKLILPLSMKGDNKSVPSIKPTPPPRKNATSTCFRALDKHGTTDYGVKSATAKDKNGDSRALQVQQRGFSADLSTHSLLSSHNGAGTMIAEERLVDRPISNARDYEPSFVSVSDLVRKFNGVQEGNNAVRSQSDHHRRRSKGLLNSSIGIKNINESKISQPRLASVTVPDLDRNSSSRDDSKDTTLLSHASPSGEKNATRAKSSPRDIPSSETRTDEMESSQKNGEDHVQLEQEPDTDSSAVSSSSLSDYATDEIISTFVTTNDEQDISHMTHCQEDMRPIPGQEIIGSVGEVDTKTFSSIRETVDLLSNSLKTTYSSDLKKRDLRKRDLRKRDLRKRDLKTKRAKKRYLKTKKAQLENLAWVMLYGVPNKEDKSWKKLLIDIRKLATSEKCVDLKTLGRLYEDLMKGCMPTLVMMSKKQDISDTTLQARLREFPRRHIEEMLSNIRKRRMNEKTNVYLLQKMVDKYKVLQILCKSPDWFPLNSQDYKNSEQVKAVRTEIGNCINAIKTKIKWNFQKDDDKYLYKAVEGADLIVNSNDSITLDHLNFLYDQLSVLCELRRLTWRESPGHELHTCLSELQHTVNKYKVERDPKTNWGDLIKQVDAASSEEVKEQRKKLQNLLRDITYKIKWDFQKNEDKSLFKAVEEARAIVNFNNIDLTVFKSLYDPLSELLKLRGEISPNSPGHELHTNSSAVDKRGISHMTLWQEDMRPIPGQEIIGSVGEMDTKTFSSIRKMVDDLSNSLNTTNPSDSEKRHLKIMRGLLKSLAWNRLYEMPNAEDKSWTRLLIDIYKLADSEKFVDSKKLHRLYNKLMEESRYRSNADVPANDLDSIEEEGEHGENTTTTLTVPGHELHTDSSAVDKHSDIPKEDESGMISHTLDNTLIPNPRQKHESGKIPKKLKKTLLEQKFTRFLEESKESSTNEEINDIRNTHRMQMKEANKLASDAYRMSSHNLDNTLITKSNNDDSGVNVWLDGSFTPEQPFVESFNALKQSQEVSKNAKFNLSDTHPQVTRDTESSQRASDEYGMISHNLDNTLIPKSNNDDSGVGVWWNGSITEEQMTHYRDLFDEFLQYYENGSNTDLQSSGNIHQSIFKETSESIATRGI